MVKRFLLLLLLASPVLADDYVVQPIGPFGTLNNFDNSYILPANKAAELLNCEISPDGKSVKKRKGYATAFALTYTTMPVHGVYNFYESGGNDVSLFFNARNVTSSIGGGSATVLYSTATNDTTWQCTDSQGFAYCVNAARDGLYKSNGSTMTMIAPAAVGTMVAVTPERLVLAGLSASPNRIDFSKANDFNTWATGSQGTDPVNFTITAPGAKVTHITYAFNRLMWFKDSSFGYILLGNQALFSDWVVKTVSPNLGTNDNSSVYWNGILYFRGQDAHIYAYDGSNIVKLTRDIQTTISASQSRRTNSWTQTSQADFQAGYTTPTDYVSSTITVGSLMLSTSAAIGSFVDTSGSDFILGTLTNLSTSTTPGAVELTIASSSSAYKAQDLSGSSEIIEKGSGIECTSNSVYQVFLATHSFFATTASVSLSRDAGYSGTAIVRLCSGNSGCSSSSSSGTIPASSIGTSEAQLTAVFITTPTLASGTTYSLQVEPGATSSSSKALRWHYSTTGTPFALEAADTFSTACSACICRDDDDGRAYGITEVNTRQYRYRLTGIKYNTSGNIVSRSFDTTFTTNTWLWNWDALSASILNSGAGTITFETQTASSTAGPFNTLVSVATGAVSTSISQEFIRYKASFTSTISTISVQLADVTIANGARKRPNGTFQSAVKNAPNITAWDALGVTKQNNDGTHTFYIRAGTFSFTTSGSTPTWTAIAAGAIPIISTGINFQVRDDFSITNATQNPTLDDFTVNWFEGQASDKAYAFYNNDSIWFSVASGTGASTNNYVFRYDLLNQGWVIYDIPINGMLVRNQSLYFGSAATGNVFKYGDTDNDNGSAINAYWKSKDFFGDSPFTDKEIANISLISKSVSGSSVTVTYTINGSSSTAYTVPLGYSNTSFVKSNKNVVAGRTGNSFNIKFGNNAADQYFEIFGIQIGYRPRPWTTSP